jgi:hypothetical protein
MVLIQNAPRRKFGLLKQKSDVKINPGVPLIQQDVSSKRQRYYKTQKLLGHYDPELAPGLTLRERTEIEGPPKPNTDKIAKEIAEKLEDENIFHPPRPSSPAAKRTRGRPRKKQVTVEEPSNRDIREMMKPKEKKGGGIADLFKLIPSLLGSIGKKVLPGLVEGAIPTVAKYAAKKYLTTESNTIKQLKDAIKLEKDPDERADLLQKLAFAESSIRK